MKQNMIYIVIGAAIAIVGGVEVAYQIYKMTVIDAEARGLKHPRLLGMLAMNGNNSSGLVLYLIGRRKYPVLHMDQAMQKIMEKRKKAAGAGLAFVVAGAIGVVLGCMM